MVILLWLFSHYTQCNFFLIKFVWQNGYWCLHCRKPPFVKDLPKQRKQNLHHMHSIKSEIMHLSSPKLGIIFYSEGVYTGWNLLVFQNKSYTWHTIKQLVFLYPLLETRFRCNKCEQSRHQYIYFILSFSSLLLLSVEFLLVFFGSCSKFWNITHREFGRL